METVTRINVAKLSEADYELAWKFPAATGRGEFYLIQDTTIIGRMEMSSALGMANGMYSHVNVSPADDATRALFEDDIEIAQFGKIYGLRYDGITGCPVQNFADEPADRHKDTVIVDVMDFDFGLAHPRFKSVEGWGKALRTNHLRIHTQHKHRRTRCSNKIKKAG